jgi:hypothetical protein
MNHDAPSCSACRDTGLVRSPRWWDDEAERVPCPIPGCLAAAEHAWDAESACPTVGPRECAS